MRRIHCAWPGEAVFYRANALFDDGTWLRKPESCVLDVARRLPAGRPLAVLDLGVGASRNTNSVLRMPPEGCRVTAVDMLETAVERVQANCLCYGVADVVHSESGSPGLARRPLHASPSTDLAEAAPPIIAALPSMRHHFRCATNQLVRPAGGRL